MGCTVIFSDLGDSSLSKLRGESEAALLGRLDTGTSRLYRIGRGSGKEATSRLLQYAGQWFWKDGVPVCLPAT
jgi:hypothetical protein